MKYKKNIVVLIILFIGILSVCFWNFIRPELVTVICSNNAVEQADKIYNTDGLINKPYLASDKYMKERHDLYSQKRSAVFIECLRANGGPFR